MIDELIGYSIVPADYKKKDPRTLLYHFPSLPVVKYAKLMQRYSFYQALDVAEDLANRQGYVLLPSVCVHWQRAQKLGPERRVKIGRHSYYLLRPYEMTKTEKSKLQNYIEELKGNESKYD